MKLIIKVEELENNLSLSCTGEGYVTSLENKILNDICKIVQVYFNKLDKELSKN